MTLDSFQKDWGAVSVHLSRNSRVLGGVTKLMIPTCIPELVVLALIFPALTVYLLAPFLVLPTTIALLTLPPLFSKVRLSRCNVSLQRGYLFVTVPGHDIISIKPKTVKPVGTDSAFISSTFNRLTLRFTSERDCTEFLSHYRSS